MGDVTVLDLFTIFFIVVQLVVLTDLFAEWCFFPFVLYIQIIFALKNRYYKL